MNIAALYMQGVAQCICHCHMRRTMSTSAFMCLTLLEQICKSICVSDEMWMFMPIIVVGILCVSLWYKCCAVSWLYPLCCAHVSACGVLFLLQQKSVL